MAITNNTLTVYHKTTANHTNTWTRYNYTNAFITGGKGSNTNKGYENANDIQIRLFYNLNSGISIANFSIGDILVIGTLTTNITSQTDITSTSYNITSITDNNFGGSDIRHIHISGK